MPKVPYLEGPFVFVGTSREKKRKEKEKKRKKYPFTIPYVYQKVGTNY
jgi:hypothetical protein